MSVPKELLEEEINLKARNKEFDEVFIDKMLKLYNIESLSNVYGDDKPAPQEKGMDYKLDYVIFSKVLKETKEKFEPESGNEYLNYFRYVFARRSKTPLNGNEKNAATRRRVNKIFEAAAKLEIDIDSFNEFEIDLLCKACAISREELLQLIEFSKTSKTISINIDVDGEEQTIDQEDDSAKTPIGPETKESVIHLFEYLKQKESKNPKKLAVYRLFVLNELLTSGVDIYEYKEIVDEDYLIYLKKYKISKPNDTSIAGFIGCTKNNISNRYRTPFNSHVKRYKEENDETCNL